MITHRTHRVLTVAAAAVAFASVVGGCAAATVTESNDAATNAGKITIPTDSGSVAVPVSSTGGTTGSGGGTTGPGEKDKQRGNTPPGTSRDGQGPAAGAIVDPSGAATGKR